MWQRPHRDGGVSAAERRRSSAAARRQSTTVQLANIKAKYDELGYDPGLEIEEEEEEERGDSPPNTSSSPMRRAALNYNERHAEHSRYARGLLTDLSLPVEEARLGSKLRFSHSSASYAAIGCTMIPHQPYNASLHIGGWMAAPAPLARSTSRRYHLPASFGRT